MSDPIRDYLLSLGYTVRCEVRSCDITAVKGEELIVIELKRGFTIDLLLQATQRQKFTESVYVALPVSASLGRRDRNSKKWKETEHLLKRLTLGLMLVAFPDDTDAPPTVEVVFHPVTEGMRRRKNKMRRAVLREIAERSADYNTGGVPGRRILTAYREQAVQIACFLERQGALSPAALRKMGASAKTQSILHRNLYGWFERLERGVYAIRASAWREVARDHAELVAEFQKKSDALSLSAEEAV